MTTENKVYLVCNISILLLFCFFFFYFQRKIFKELILKWGERQKWDQKETQNKSYEEKNKKRQQKRDSYRKC